MRLFYLVLICSGDSTDDASGGGDLSRLGKEIHRLEMARKGVRFDVLRPQVVGELVDEPVKEQHPPGLIRI